MMSEDLDRALGKTPPSFDEKMRRTLRGLPQEKIRQHANLRRAAALGLALAALCSTAVALVSQGLNWYYNNRFTAYQQHEPERYKAIINHLQTDVVQTKTADDEIDIAVTEVSWAPEQQMMVVELTAVARDAEHMELHPMDNLDADSAYVGKGNLGLYPYDEEAREEHWLWTEKGFGPVADMIAPEKELLLVECGWVYLDGNVLIGDMSSMDCYVGEDGSVHFILEVRIDSLLYPDPADEDDIRLSMAENLCQAMERGELMLTIPYAVIHFSADDDQLYNGGRKGEISFSVPVEVP